MINADPLTSHLVTHERMSPEFEKWHLGEGRALHHFTGPDTGGPHDHPGAIDVHVVAGGYVERVYTIAPDGSWSSDLVTRRPDDRFTIQPERIHEIVSLPTGECWTLATYGPHVRETRFWRFDGGEARSRAWHEAEFVG